MKVYCQGFFYCLEMITINDTEVLKKVQYMSQESDEALQQELADMAENYGFYIGDKQWDEGTRRELLSQQKPALTLNLVFPVINLLCGMENSNQQDFIIYPRKGGYRLISDILTRLLKHTMDISDGNFEQSIAFLDGAICGKGWLKVDITHQLSGFIDPFNGQIDVSRKSPFDIREDPNATKYDLNRGGKYIIELFWYDKEGLMALYPKKKDMLKSGLEELSGDDVIDFHGRPKDKSKFLDPSYYRYRVKDTWWMSWQTREFLIDKTNLNFKMVHPSQEDLLRAILQQDRKMAIEQNRPERFNVTEMPVKILNLTTTVGDRVLENIEDPLQGIQRFPLTRFAPYWVDGKCFGAVDNIKDAQREFNKRRSQILHIINQSANSGYLVPREGAIDIEQLEKEGADPGVIVEYSRNQKPEKITPNQPPVAHINAAQMNKQDIQDISGLNPDLTQFSGTQGSQGQSGVAIARKQQQGMMVSQTIFNNYYKFEREFGLTLMEFIRKSNVYTAEEILQVVEDSEMKNTTPRQVLQALSSWKTGQYGCKLGTKPTSPTSRVAAFDELMQMANAGLPIPPQILLEYVDIPDKERVIQIMQQTQQQQQQMELQKMILQASTGKGQGSQPAEKGTPSPPKSSPISKNV